MSKWMRITFILVGAASFGILLLSACAGDPTPTPTPTPESMVDRAKSLAEDVIENLRGALEEMDSLEDLTQAGLEGSQELIGHLCDIVAGEYEPHLTLDNLTDSFVLRTGIRGYCATR